MGIWIHLLEFGRDDPAGPKYDDMVLGRIEHLGDDHPDQLVARARAVGLPDRTGDEDPDLPGFYFIFIDDIAVRPLEFGEVEGRTCQDCSLPLSGISLLLPTHYAPAKMCRGT